MYNRTSFDLPFCVIVGIGPEGGPLAEQIYRKWFEKENGRLCLINASGMPVTVLDLGGCDIGVVIVDAESCNRRALLNLQRSLNGMKTRPLLMGIVLPGSAKSPIHFDPAGGEKQWADCLWQPRLADIPTTLTVAVRHWIELYMNSGCVGFDRDDYLLLFQSPLSSTRMHVAVARDTFLLDGDPHSIMARLAHEIETTMEPLQLTDISKMLITVEFCMKNASIGSLEAIMNACNDRWCNKHRIVQVAFSPVSSPDDGDYARLVAFLILT